MLGEFPFNDPNTNIGYVISPIMKNLYPDGTSVKLVVHPQLINSDKDPALSISFTCNGKLTESIFKEKSLLFTLYADIKSVKYVLCRASVSCSVEHVILNIACSLEDEDTVDVEKYCLRVWGLAEYFAPNTTLSQYEYIHQCIKLEKDIELAIMNKAQIKQSIARTVSDREESSFMARACTFTCTCARDQSLVTRYVALSLSVLAAR